MSHSNDRIFLIQDALSGLGYQMAAPETVIYPFVDYLSVLLQSGKIITIWNVKTNELIFSSLGDQALIDKYGQPSPSDKRVRMSDSYGIQINHLNPEKGDSGQNADRQAFEQVLERLREADQPFLDRLFDAISIYGRPSFEPPKAIDLDRDDMEELLAPMRKLIDQVFYDLRQSPVFQVRQYGVETAKLFAVVRTVQSSQPRYNGIFNYTASLLLSEAQRFAITRMLEAGQNSAEAKRSLEFLESPLGLNDRSVADTVFCSGNVGFKGKVGVEHDIAGDDTARQRQKVEDFVYKKLSKVDRDQNLYVFYIPVHVAGIPWLAMFTFTDRMPQQDPLAWKGNYLIYRDVVPRITSQIRSGAREIYLNFLADRLTKRLHRTKLAALPLEALVGNVSHDWQKLNQVYPYARVRLKLATEASPDDTILHVGEGQRVAIEFSEDSTFLRQDVKYDLLDRSSVTKVCQSALERYTSVNASLQQRAVAYQTHGLRNSLNGLRVILDHTVVDEQARLALNQQIDELLALEQFSNYLIGFKDSRKPTFVSAANAQKFTELEETINKALTAFENHSYADNSADRLIQIKSRRSLTTSFAELQNVSANTVLEFCPTQMNVVVNGLISNALKYNQMDSPALHLNLVIVEDKVFLEVRNPSDESTEDLQTLAADLSSPADLHLNLIGANLIHLACRAVDFSAPAWTNDGGELRAMAQVAQMKHGN
jgi:hypothetical protein